MRFSQNDKYSLPYHRGQQLYYLCLCYPLWLREYNELGQLKGRIYDDAPGRGSGLGNPTEAAAIRREELARNMRLIEKACRLSDPELSPWLLRGVTDDHVTYNTLSLKYDIPCSINTYQERKRRVYWLLDQLLTPGYLWKDWRRGRLVYFHPDGTEVKEN